MDLVPLLNQQNTFTLLLAPAGSGKTGMILNQVRHDGISKLVFLSPLRALADEFSDRVQGAGIRSFLCSSGSEVDEVIRRFNESEFGILIITPELLINRLDLIPCNIPFVFDEFHLFYYWGDEFRPILHEIYYGVVNRGHPVLSLTATLSRSHLERLRLEMELGSDHYYIINLGNRLLKNYPQNIFYLPNQKKYFYKFLLSRLCKKKSDETILFFTRTRQEVFSLETILRRKGHKVAICVGGGVKDFRESISEMDNIDCIVATSVLAQGVNLPRVSTVMISYELSNFDHLVQMVGRGGRTGDNYDVVCADAFGVSKMKFLKEQMINRLLLKIFPFYDGRMRL